MLSIPDLCTPSRQSDSNPTYFMTKDCPLQQPAPFYAKQLLHTVMQEDVHTPTAAQAIAMRLSQSTVHV